MKVRAIFGGKFKHVKLCAWDHLSKNILTYSHSKKVRNTLSITFKMIKETLRLTLKKRKKIVEGATVLKFQNKLCKLWYFLYFHAPGVKQGVKTSQKLQGTRISRFGALKFSQNWTNFENPLQNRGFWLKFRRFWRFFNFGWILADQT